MNTRGIVYIQHHELGASRSTPRPDGTAPGSAIDVDSQISVARQRLVHSAPYASRGVEGLAQ